MGIQCKFLEETNGLAHSRFDVKRLDILPVLLEEGDEEVDAQHDIGENLILGHLNVANGNTQAKHFLQLELDCRLDFDNLVGEVLRMADGGRELASFRKTRTKKTRNLLDQGFRGQESIVLLSKLLDELLVLVKLLQVIGGHVLKLNLLGAIDISRVSKNAE